MPGMNQSGEITREQKDFAVDALTSMVIDDLSVQRKENPDKILSDFISSKTGQLLYDESSGLWKNGPCYIEDLYREELEKGSREASADQTTL